MTPIIFIYRKGDAAGEPGGRDEMVFGHLYRALQPAAQALWPSVQRSIQVFDRGRERQRVFENSVRLRASQSGPVVAWPPTRRCGNIPWSSWPEYLKRPAKRWPWLRVDRLLGEYQIPKDSAAGRRQLEHALEERRGGETGADYKKLRRGWCSGAASFRKELLGQMQERLGAEHYGAERQETMEEHAEGIIVEELKHRRWGERELRQHSKGDAVKVALAVRLRAETDMTVRWIAGRLQMGTPTYVNHLLYRWRKGKGK